jgi:sec-independent protein translocase protein TatA
VGEVVQDLENRWAALRSAAVTPQIGPLELVVVLIVALLVLGPKRLPDVGASLGKSFRGFKDALDGKEEEITEPPEAEVVSESEVVPGTSAPSAGPGSESRQ